MSDVTIVEASFAALNDMVAKSEKELQEVVYKLAEALGQYGFQGRAQLHLAIELDDEFGKGEHASIERSAKVSFK